jgi:hypothetical protein
MKVKAWAVRERGRILQHEGWLVVFASLRSGKRWGYGKYGDKLVSCTISYSLPKRRSK